MKIGILHPGEMGASVGAAARAAGNAVSWASAGRSEATRRRAEESGLEDAGTVEALIAGSESSYRFARRRPPEASPHPSSTPASPVSTSTPTRSPR